MKTSTDNWVKAEVGMTLEPGDTIKSGQNSNAEITFFDGSTIELQSGTQIEVTSLDIAADTGSTTILLKQEIGNTISRVTKLVDPASRYEVETPAGVAAVRGSVLLVYVIEDGTTWVTNQEGHIWAIAQGVELQIPEGRRCIIRPGQPPKLISLGGYGGGGGGGGSKPSIVTDLAIDMSDSSDPVDPGTNLIYTLQITNNGPSDSTGAVVLDALPSDVSFVSATDGGTYDSGSHTVSWAIGTLAKDASTSVSITVKVNESTPPGIITNTATVDANEGDNYSANDTAAEDTTINAVNDPPVAVGDSATTPEDTPVTIDVLANDSDVDGDTLTIDSVTQSANGSVTNNGSDVTYTPAPDFNGADSFTYTVSDGNGGISMATVTITINGINDAPVVTDIPDQSIAEGGTFATINLDDYVSDVDNTNAEMTWTYSGNTDLTVNIDASRVATIGIPNADWNGSEDIIFTATDPGLLFGNDDATFTVTAVNDPPVAVDDSATTDEDNPVTVAASGVLNNDSDPDVGDTLSVTAVDTSGTVGAVTAWSADGSFTYDPNGKFEYLQTGGSATDSFTYTVSDGNGSTDTAIVTITINGVNDAPMAVADSASTDEDTSVNINVLGNDSDPDGDPLTVTSVTDTSHGTATIETDNTVTYTPDTGYSGTDSLTYTISDGNGGTDTATVTVTVIRTLARINIQIDTGPTASIFIWDDTTNGWATDEDTQGLVDGTNHVTSDTITVAAGHYYYVWVEAADAIFYVKNYPKDWIITPAPEGGVGEAAYGYAAAGSHYSVHFSVH